jgi:hypothetical protein
LLPRSPLPLPSTSLPPTSILVVIAETSAFRAGSYGAPVEADEHRAAREEEEEAGPQPKVSRMSRAPS